jgi:hypothetical protein
MFERVNEPVRILAGFEQDGPRVRVRPYLIDWRDKRYKVEIMGLHHPAKRGDQNFHVFEFSSGNTKFAVELNTETLAWTLTEVYYDYSA